MFGAIGSFFASMTIISFCAAEIVAIASVLGVLSHVSDSLLGLSILTWGNGLADLVSSLSLARHGYSEMAVSACLGGPIFSKLNTAFS